MLIEETTLGMWVVWWVAPLYHIHVFVELKARADEPALTRFQGWM
jgi:hypothetical protein